MEYFNKKLLNSKYKYDSKIKNQDYHSFRAELLLAIERNSNKYFTINLLEKNLLKNIFSDEEIFHIISISESKEVIIQLTAVLNATEENKSRILKLVDELGQNSAKQGFIQEGIGLNTNFLKVGFKNKINSTKILRNDFLENYLKREILSGFNEYANMDYNLKILEHIILNDYSNEEKINSFKKFFHIFSHEEFSHDKDEKLKKINELYEKLFNIDISKENNFNLSILFENLSQLKSLHKYITLEMLVLNEKSSLIEFLQNNQFGDKKYEIIEEIIRRHNNTVSQDISSLLVTQNKLKFNIGTHASVSNYSYAKYYMYKNLNENKLNSNMSVFFSALKREGAESLIDSFFKNIAFEDEKFLQSNASALDLMFDLILPDKRNIDTEFLRNVANIYIKSDLIKYGNKYHINTEEKNISFFIQLLLYEKDNEKYKDIIFSYLTKYFSNNDSIRTIIYNPKIEEIFSKVINLDILFKSSILIYNSINKNYKLQYETPFNTFSFNQNKLNLLSQALISYSDEDYAELYKKKEFLKEESIIFPMLQSRNLSVEFIFEIIKEPKYLKELLKNPNIPITIVTKLLKENKDNLYPIEEQDDLYKFYKSYAIKLIEYVIKNEKIEDEDIPNLNEYFKKELLIFEFPLQNVVESLKKETVKDIFENSFNISKENMELIKHIYAEENLSFNKVLMDEFDF